MSLKCWEQVPFTKVNFTSPLNQIWPKIIQVNSTDVYLIAGLEAGGDMPVNRCFKLNIKNMQMTEIQTINMGRSAFGIVCIYNYIYCMGGSAGLGHYLNSCEKYDTITGKWSEFPSLPEHTIASSSVQFENRFIYMVGGFSYRSYTINYERFISTIY